MAKIFSAVSGIRNCAFSLKTQMLNVKGTTSHAQNYSFSPDVCTSREMLSFAITADFKFTAGVFAAL